MKKLGCGTVGCLVFVIAGFLTVDACFKADWNFDVAPSRPLVPWNEQEDLAGAFEVAKQYVAAEVPGEITWPGYVEGTGHVVPWEDQHYTIASWFETADGRHVYLIKMVQVSDGQWRASELTIDGQKFEPVP